MPETSHTRFYDQLTADADAMARFHGKVAKAGPDDCWPWQSGRSLKEYGRFKLGRVMIHSNRVAWALANGRDPGDLIIRHTCDNPPCCNPAHLVIGTHADNARDKMERGRWRSGDQRGEHNGRALLKAEHIPEIVRALRRGEPNTRIARRYPVGHSLISRIATARSWQREAAAAGWEPAIEYLRANGEHP